MIQDVTKRFDDAIIERFQNLDIRNALLKHERKMKCIENLCDEIRRAEFYSLNINLDTYSRIIKDIAMMFSKAALQHIEEQYYSTMKRRQIEAEYNRLKDAQDLIQDLEEATINDKGLTEIERQRLQKARS